MNFTKKNKDLSVFGMKHTKINRFYVNKKIITVVVFVFAVFLLNSCKSTSSCSSIEKQEINNDQTNVALSTEIA